jgi:hypothetical protein
MDKQTLSEQLTEIAEWMDKEGRAWDREGYQSHDYHTKAAKVRAIAEQMKGKVVCDIAAAVYPHIVMVEVDGSDGDGTLLRGRGKTPEEAIANLQTLLDGQG